MLALQGYKSSDDEDDPASDNSKVEVNNDNKLISNQNSIALSMKICAAPEVVPTVSIFKFTIIYKFNYSCSKLTNFHLFTGY